MEDLVSKTKVEHQREEASINISPGMCAYTHIHTLHVCVLTHIDISKLNTQRRLRF